LKFFSKHKLPDAILEENARSETMSIMVEEEYLATAYTVTITDIEITWKSVVVVPSMDTLIPQHSGDVGHTRDEL
jgi:hypothetical protein